MPEYGTESKANLATVHPILRLVCNRAISLIDHKVICGWRGEAAQHEAFISGKSQLDWPKSNHNRQVYSEIMRQWTPESFAVDLAPFPIDYWSESSTEAQKREGTLRFYYLAGVMIGIADEIDLVKCYGMRLRWGGNWKMDGVFYNEKFRDVGHFEIIKA